MTFKRNRGDGASGREVAIPRRVLIVVTAVLAEVAGLWFRAHKLGGNVVVRCHAGHLYTTIWIPALSLKSLRFGGWRFQYCPVGRHWSLVTPVRESDLTGDEKRVAGENRDIRIP